MIVFISLSLYFEPAKSLYLKWISYIQHIVESCFFKSLLKIDIFRPLTFKVIIDLV